MENTGGSDKLFGKYHELSMLIIGFALTTIVGGQLLLGINLLHNNEKKKQLSSGNNRSAHRINLILLADLWTSGSFV